MDSVIDIKNIPILDSMPIDSNVRKKIRLLTVFGCNGEEVIYVTNEDKVYGYGRNRFGGLGLSTYEENKKSPQLNETLSGKQISTIFCGFEHWTALTENGKCYAWGKNDYGQLGNASIEPTATPQYIKELSNEKVVQLCCGHTHTMALTSDGLVYSWGSNKSGQLGNGYKGFLATPKLMTIKDKVMTISCGKNHCIALSTTGKAYLWGLNNYGQLGQVVTNEIVNYFPKLLPNMESMSFSKVICGPNYTLLLTSDGSVYAFGDNSCGQIGNGTMKNQCIPFKVISNIKDIIAHKENDVSIAISTDDSFYVWGLAKNRRYLKPKEITDSTLKSSFDIYAKYAKTKLTFKTLIVSEVIIRCQTNRRTQKNSIDFQSFDSNKLIESPKKVINEDLKSNEIHLLDDILDLKSFPILYTTLSNQRVRNSIRLLRVFGIKGCKVIFVTNDDKVYCFGLNRDGSLGLTSHEIKIRKPALNEVLSGKQLIDISPGFEHCLGLTASGLVYGWGQNRYGQLGNGNTEDQVTPQLVKDLADLKVVQIKCGAYFSLALTSDGELFSWGHNTFAQLGDRTYNSRETPTQVFISEKVVAISCGTNHSMALTQSGRVYLWGNNTVGQLGRDPALDVQKSREKPMSNRPRLLEGLENVQKAVCGENHSLVLTNDGFLYTFGDNTYGQIGNGSVEHQFTPLKINNNKIKIKDIVSNFDVDFSIAVSEEDKCYVWGYVQFKNILRPKAIPESSERLFDIYGLYSTNKTMFKALVVNTLEQITHFGLRDKESEYLIESEESFYHLFPQNLFNFSTNELIIRKEMIDLKEVKAFDEEIDINLFPILSSTLKDINVRKNIKLLYVFGKSGSNVIFGTKDDKIYGFGLNSDGCLGLGTYEQHIKSPTLNETLSYNQIIDIRSGFKHCLALTASGLCYAWGQNRYGQLGIGTEQPLNSPKPIKYMKDKKVIQISCGANHSMALTASGEIYSWGLNVLGQLGTSNYQNYFSPAYIEVKHPIVSISCGLNHSSAVDNIGMSYAWGHNKFGQLGRERERDYRPERKEWVANRPSSNLYFKNITFIKSICGPNHTLFLTNDGYIYAFGDNTNGQVGNGNGEIEQQFRPIRINEEIRFKDIITHFGNDLSIGISIDGQYYIWGLANKQKVLSPHLIPESNKESVFNIYAKYSYNKITFKTIVFNETKALNPKVIESNDEENSYENKDFDSNNMSASNDSNESYVNSIDGFHQSFQSGNGFSEESVTVDNMSFQSSIQSSNPSLTFQNRLNQCFNNQKNSDLKIISEDKVIYCHKTIIQIRNQKFWQILNEKLNENKDEIRINDEKFELFYAFLQYLYGIEPEFNERVIFDLQSMATHFDENDLWDDCQQYINRLGNKPNLLNVCPLFEKAINQGLADLENSCIEFAANNWKTVVKSEEFLTMNDSLSKRLMFFALNFK